jgi:hypothetical protein
MNVASSIAAGASARSGARRRPPTHWHELLTRPSCGHHIAQIYQDEKFLTEAAARFIGAGLEQGDGVVAIVNMRHWEAIARRLKADGRSVKDAVWRGQLHIMDADTVISRIMRDGMPDWVAFQNVVGGGINQVVSRFSRVRAFGEMVDILWRTNERAAAIRLENFWNYLAAVQGCAIFCAYFIDNLDAETYGGALESVCKAHTHLIPASDYEHFDNAINEAGEAVLGKPLARMLKSLAATERPLTDMPAAQAAIMWLKKYMPAAADRVLARARARRSDARLRVPAGTRHPLPRTR